MYRAVLDPGVLIAALISGTGAPASLVVAWIEGRFDLVVSPRLLVEVERVLERPKFRRYVTSDDFGEFVALLHSFGTMVPDPIDVTPGLTPDPGDDYLVALARDAGARFLISGDAHLTRLEDPSPPVLTPRAFLDLLTTEDR